MHTLADPLDPRSRPFSKQNLQEDELTTKVIEARRAAFTMPWLAIGDLVRKATPSSCDTE